MKKRYLFPVLMLLLLLITAMLSFPSVNAAQSETDTYYYDRIPEQAQKCYRWLKAYYDSGIKEPGEYKHDFTSWLPTNPTQDQIDRLNEDLIVGDIALKADEPLYQWKGSVTHALFGTETKLLVTITRYDLLTADIQKRADARIRQIVETVGTGDRYTQLRKLTSYLSSTSFYDPYLWMIDTSDDHGMAALNFHYNTSVYGLLLEGIAVCDGFSQLAKLLCDELNIPCIIMGNASHAWNLVQMEDGKWYRLDLTDVVPLGLGGLQMSEWLDAYFQNTFLNNSDPFGRYNDPYMISLNEKHYVEEFPEHADQQYQYTGSTTDFSYTIAVNTYTPGNPKFCYRVNSDGKTCTITNYEGRESGDLTIPDTLDGYLVTAIDSCAFYYCTDFTGTLTIPDSVESIGPAAFAACDGFTSVKLPAKLQEIGNSAFIGCKGLTEVIVPDLVDTLGDYAFYDCNKLRTVTFGSHIQTIGTGAFDNLANGVVLKAPAGSIVQTRAAESGLAFQASGSLCDFLDADSQWEIENDCHFHTCQHGGRFDLGLHTNASGSFYCGMKCDVCNAEACSFYGLMKSAFTLINEKPATCNSAAYSGDLQCICGIRLQDGMYYGEPTGQHAPADSQWEYNDFEHWQACACGEHIDLGYHIGGTATATQQAKCSVCGVSYGPLKLDDTGTETEPTDSSTESSESEPTDSSTESSEPEPTDSSTETSEPEPTDSSTETSEPEPTDSSTESSESEPTDSSTEPSESEPIYSPTQPTQLGTPTDGSNPSSSDADYSVMSVLLIGLAVVVVIAGGIFGFWFLQQKSKKSS